MLHSTALTPDEMRFARCVQSLGAFRRNGARLGRIVDADSRGRHGACGRTNKLGRRCLSILRTSKASHCELDFELSHRAVDLRREKRQDDPAREREFGWMHRKLVLITRLGVGPSAGECKAARASGRPERCATFKTKSAKTDRLYSDFQSGSPSGTRGANHSWSRASSALILLSA
jgi:hypothetical protein